MENYSVLTTVYEKEDPSFLRASIESMLAQSVLTNDYVIVKDGPLNDALDSVLEEYTKQYDFFNIVALKENVGLGAALRAGLSACKNDLVARLDSDDISLPNRCECQLKAFEADKDLVIVGTDMYEFNNDPDEIIAVKIMPHTPEELYRYGKRRNAFNHSSVMYRKSVIEAHGSYSTMRRSQDVELFSKILFHNCKCINLDQPLIKFRCGDTRVKRKKSWRNVRSDLRIFWGAHKMGYSSFVDYVYVLAIQLGFYILPEKMAGYLYRKLFRASSKKAD